MTLKYLPDAVWPRATPGAVPASAIFAGSIDNVNDLIFVYLMVKYVRRARCRIYGRIGFAIYNLILTLFLIGRSSAAQCTWPQTAQNHGSESPDSPEV